jgi:surfeit locus 1 family protein
VPVEVTGLLRLTEPHGGFLRGNDPQADRWASRDIAAMAAHRHIAALPDWFIDAQSMRPDQPVDAAITAHQPMAGLTVVSFPNNHLAMQSPGLRLRCFLWAPFCWCAASVKFAGAVSA